MKIWPGRSPDDYQEDGRAKRPGVARSVSRFLCETIEFHDTLPVAFVLHTTHPLVKKILALYRSAHKLLFRLIPGTLSAEPIMVRLALAKDHRCGALRTYVVAGIPNRSGL